MYGRKKALLWLNVAFFLVELIATVVILVHQFPNTRPLSAPDWVIGSCYNYHDKDLALAFVAPALFEAYLAALAAFRLYREYKAISMPLRGGILQHLVRDSVIYFVFIAVVMCANIVLFLRYPVVPGTASTGLVEAAGAIGGTRLLLSMHEAADPSRRTLTRSNFTHDVSTSGEIEFRRRSLGIDTARA